MSVIYLVLPLAVLIAAGMLVAFIRSARSGQFDDLKTPALRMLFDEQPAKGERGEDEPAKESPKDAATGDTSADDAPKGGSSGNEAP